MLMKTSPFPNKIIFNSILLLNSILFSCYSSTVLSQSSTKEICFNFYIVTKKTAAESEAGVFEKQKNLLLHQLSKSQSVFDENLERKCPAIKLSKGKIRQIVWKNAHLLSKPVDQGSNEATEAYLFRKFTKASSDLSLIVQKIREQEKMSYRSLLRFYPGRAIVKANNFMNKLIEHRKTLNNIKSDDITKLQIMISNNIEKIKLKLDSYMKESSVELIQKARERISKYEKVDQVSASTWAEGELVFWNDLEAQDTSVELKNLLKYYRTSDNQCLDLYVIPNGKTPSRHNKEANKNGKWTSRGGATISTKNFPRTTNGIGDAILLTYNTRESETRLAHELVHLLLGKGDAHAEKKEKDLMHEHSKGGSYLDEIECEQIRENALEFYGGVTESRKN